MKIVRRGEVYWVNLNPVVGSEIAKTRPAVIISNDIGNQYADRVIIAPISSGNSSKIYPFEVRLNAGEGGVAQDCKVLLDQIRAVDKSRLGQRLGMLSDERITEINRAIRLSLDV